MAGSWRRRFWGSGFGRSGSQGYETGGRGEIKGRRRSGGRRRRRRRRRGGRSRQVCRDYRRPTWRNRGSWRERVCSHGAQGGRRWWKRGELGFAFLGIEGGGGAPTEGGERLPERTTELVKFYSHGLEQLTRCIQFGLSLSLGWCTVLSLQIEADL